MYIDPQDVTEFDREYFIDNLTCISYEKAYCNTAVMEMIGLHHGIDKSLHYYNWLTGFTYGAAAFMPDYLTAYGPYTDPEPGNRFAAPFLGLQRHYLVTNGEDVFVRAVKSFLSRGYPLRIALDAGIYGAFDRFAPHAILVVGYDSTSVFYYETALSNRRIQDYPGESMSWETFTAAVKNMRAGWRYPWIYNLTYFTPSETDTDLQKVWQRNAEGFIGFDYTSVVAGSMAVAALADTLQGRELSDSETDAVERLLEKSVYTRADNADFISGSFDDATLLEAAELLRQASELYAAIDIEDNAAMVADLQQCADLENRLGLLMQQYAAGF